MNKRWQPVPVAVASECLKITWSKANPAPRPVGYLWAWCLLEQDTTISRRELAQYAGWSEWKARNVLDEVTADFNAWKHGTPDSAQIPPETAHSTSRKTRVYEAPPPAPSAPRARVPFSSQEQLTTTKQEPAKTDSLDPVVEEIWTHLRGLRQGDFRLTQRTRRELKKRIKATSPDEVRQVLEWWQTSDHSRAQWLRKGDFGISTILKEDNFYEYLKFSSQPATQQIDESDPFQALALARHLRTQGGIHE